MRRLLLLLPSWTPSWVLLPAFEPDYRRLVLWSYGLVIRVRMMEWVVLVVAPHAPLGLVAMLNRRSQSLSAEVAALKRAVRARHGPMARRVTAQPQGIPTGNPWI
jgi:hypothetical protein